PQACTGCGQCVEICPENALELVPQSESLLREHQAAFHLWEELPDTSG
ncbi:MAG: 4Fe-4S binding protein, partial [Saprospiraceae bacterium]|nr:4Fe-4S binding protein [Saprospiraceae bacterium]